MDSTRFIIVLQVFSICFLAVIAMTIIVVTKPAEGAGKFTIDSKTSVQNTKGPIKFKVIASANGETIAKKQVLYPIPISEQ